jgi:SHS2 domain-containing protein
VHRLLAHTADLRAELSAPDFDALCGEAVDLVREIVAGTSAVGALEERRVRLARAEDGERFFRFVRELVYLVDAEAFLPGSCRRSGETMVVLGERFDPNRHRAERQIKALTRHHYRYERAGTELRAELIFDL